MIILGITAGANAVAETIGEMIFKGQSHQTRNMVLEPLMASALMFGGFVLSGYSDFNDMKSASMALGLGFGLNLTSDVLGDYLLKM